MEPLFENRYIQDETFVKEFYQYTFFRRPINIALYVIMGLCLLACAVLTFVFGLQYLREMWEFFFFVLLFLGLEFFSYFRQVNTAQKQRKEIHPEPVEAVLTVTQDTITISAENDPPRSVGLDKIKRVFQTKNYVFLRSEAKLCYGFRKDAFTKGSTVEMMLFLKEKGIKGAK